MTDYKELFEFDDNDAVNLVEKELLSKLTVSVKNLIDTDDDDFSCGKHQKPLIAI